MISCFHPFLFAFSVFRGSLRARTPTKKPFRYMEVVVVVVGGRILWKTPRTPCPALLFGVDNRFPSRGKTGGVFHSFPVFVHIPAKILRRTEEPNVAAVPAEKTKEKSKKL